jgi:hypothetical protein
MTEITITLPEIIVYLLVALMAIAFIGNVIELIRKFHIYRAARRAAKKLKKYGR